MIKKGEIGEFSFYEFILIVCLGEIVILGSYDRRDYMIGVASGSFEVIGDREISVESQ